MAESKASPPPPELVPALAVKEAFAAASKAAPPSSPAGGDSGGSSRMMAELLRLQQEQLERLQQQAKRSPAAQSPRADPKPSVPPPTAIVAVAAAPMEVSEPTVAVDKKPTEPAVAAAAAPIEVSEPTVAVDKKPSEPAVAAAAAPMEVAPVGAVSAAIEAFGCVDEPLEVLEEQERLFETLRLRRQQEEADRAFAAKLAEEASSSSSTPAAPAAPAAKPQLTRSGEMRARMGMGDDLSGIGELADLMRVLEESSAAESARERAAITDPGLRSLADMFPGADVALLREVLSEAKGDIATASAVLLGDPDAGAAVGTLAGPRPPAPPAAAIPPDRPELARLAFIFPSADRGTLDAALRECRGNVDEAVAWLLGDTVPHAPEPPPGLSGPGVTEEMRRLSMMFPAAGKAVLENALGECDNDVQRAVAWLLGEPTSAPVPVPDPYEPTYEPEEPYYDPEDPYVDMPAVRGGKPLKMPHGFKVPPLPRIDWRRPCQTFIHAPRGVESTIKNASRSLSNPAWANYCFHKMVEREQELYSTHVVFYHSYSLAALLYEVHGVLAQALYKRAGNCPLPRLLSAPFDERPELSMLVSNFGKLRGQDHDPVFRALAISTSVSLLGLGTEAPPMSCFEMGYSCSDLSFRGLLTGLLTTCGLSRGRSETVCDNLVRIGAKYGLPVGVYGSKGSRAGGPGTLSGHMLQVFVSRELADDLAYACAAYGVPTKGAKLSVMLSPKAKAAPTGQARVWMHPEIFTDTSKTMLFHYAASPTLSSGIELPNGRDAMVAELREALGCLLDTPDAFKRTEKGIRGITRH